MLPIEYQSQIDALKKRQMMAQLLQKQGLNPAIAQSQGRMAARTSPLSFLSSALSSYIGTQADAKADQGISGVKQKYATDARGAVDTFLKTPEEEQDAFAAKTPFAPVREIAKTLAERKKQRVSDFITAVKDVDPAAAGGAALAGNVPRTPYSVPGLKPSETGNLPDGTAYVRDFNRKNEPTTRLVRPPMQINNIPAAGERAATVALAGKLPAIAETVKGQMEKAVDAADKADRIGILVQDPTVITGFGADPARFLASLATKLRITGPDAVSKTQSLLSQIAEQTLDASMDLKGAITEKEWPRLAQARAGEISYSPPALLELSYIAKARAFNEYIRAARQRNAAAQSVDGGENIMAAYPIPSFSPGDMPATLFKPRPDGTVVYVGSIENIIKSSNAAPQAPAGPQGVRYNPTTKKWEAVQ